MQKPVQLLSVNQRISGEEIDYSTQRHCLDINLSSDEFDNRADTHEGMCSIFSQRFAHPWEFISGLTK